MPVGVGIGSAVLGAGTSLINGANASDAASQAAAAQTSANQAAIAEQQREFNAQQANIQPWLAAGGHALSAQGDLLGLNGGGAQQGAITGLQSSPLFQSLYKTGQNTVLNNAAATGGLRGGNAAASLFDVGQQTLASVIQQQLANLSGISNTGQQSATSINASGANSSNAISQLLANSGAATGGGILGSTAAGNSGMTGAASALTNLLGSGLFKSGGLGADVSRTIAANPSIF